MVDIKKHRKENEQRKNKEDEQVKKEIRGRKIKKLRQKMNGRKY
jgi:hypothetical protein